MAVLSEIATSSTGAESETSETCYGKEFFAGLIGFGLRRQTMIGRNGSEAAQELVLGWIVMDGVCTILHQVSSMLYKIGADKSQATDSSGVSQNTAPSCLVVSGI